MDHAAEAHCTDLMTITRHVLNEQTKHPEARGDFTILLSHIVLGCKFVCSAVSKFVLSTGTGVNGFTLDPSLGEFILTHPNIKALDITPTNIHQRSPIFLGSFDDIEEIKALYAAKEAIES